MIFHRTVNLTAGPLSTELKLGTSNKHWEVWGHRFRAAWTFNCWVSHVQLKSCLRTSRIHTPWRGWLFLSKFWFPNLIKRFLYGLNEMEHDILKFIFFQEFNHWDIVPSSKFILKFIERYSLILLPMEFESALKFRAWWIMWWLRIYIKGGPNMYGLMIKSIN